MSPFAVSGSSRLVLASVGGDPSVLLHLPTITAHPPNPAISTAPALLLRHRRLATLEIFLDRGNDEFTHLAARFDFQ
jgi:hypothetical protein